MIKTIILIDSVFPFEKAESFLESEIKNYEHANIWIAPILVQSKAIKREISDSIKILPLPNNNTFSRKLRKLLSAVFACFHQPFYTELLNLFKTKKLHFTTLKRLFQFIAVSEDAVYQISKAIKHLKINTNDILFYSYWMHVHAYAGIRLKKRYQSSKAVTRCHGYDLYEDRASHNYIPMRRTILENMDQIYCISQHGADYLNNTYPDVKKHVEVSHLGTPDYGVGFHQENDTFRIVSCSWVVPVKRISKIIDALSLVGSIPVEWIHFGDGQLLNDIKNRAKKLPSNITCVFPGALPNQDILNFYKTTCIDAFVNVSESEGIPVSIMEAISFGIPAIATDVGGTCEIVIDQENGYLLKKEFTDQELLSKIITLYHLSEAQTKKLHEHTRIFWSNHFSEQTNYKKFIHSLKDVMDA